MDFMENMKNIVENTAQVVAKKSGEVFESSKIRYAMFDLSNEVKKLYAEIGEAFYESYKTGDSVSDDVVEKCRQIDVKRAEILNLTDQLAGIKSEVSCPVCGRKCKVENNFCPYCGSEIAISVDSEVHPGSEPKEETQKEEQE